MSLYYDAITVLSTNQKKGSLKSRVYSKDLQLKSTRSHVYALIKEVAKCDSFLKEVVENSGILSQERTLTPLLALLTVHDQCFNRKLQTTKDHPLRLLIERHKARIQAEFAKALLRRKLNRNSNPYELKKYFVQEAGHVVTTSPRWVRENYLKIDDGDFGMRFMKAFRGLRNVKTLQETIAFSDWDKSLGAIYNDKHVPGLYAYSHCPDLTESEAYVNGDLILQDKASCFPAWLLLGDQTREDIGDCVDGCAAPGNKTTHMASIISTMSEEEWKGRIFACERDTLRSITLQLMTEKAAADKMVTILPRQDFLALDPTEERFANVTHLLLDPSCSGSGITKREDIPQFDLPQDPKAKDSTVNGKSSSTSGSRKRKRELEQKIEQKEKKHSFGSVDPGIESDEQEMEVLDNEEEYHPAPFDKERLRKLSNLQSMIVEHAMSFPAAKRLTYSTCSIHVEENEAVVEKILNSSIAISRGWRVQKRIEQVKGMQEWPHRGLPAAGKETKAKGSDGKIPSTATHSLTDREADACIRCWPDDGEGTMGFFVCGFVRDSHFMIPEGNASDARVAATENGENDEEGDDNGEEHIGEEDVEEKEWEGFDDDILLGEKTALRSSQRRKKKPKKYQMP